MSTSQLNANYSQVSRSGDWINNFGLSSYPAGWSAWGYTTQVHSIYRINYTLTNLRQNGTTGSSTINMFMRLNGGRPLQLTVSRSRDPDPSEPNVLLLGMARLNAGTKIEFGYNLEGTGSVGYDQVRILIEY